MEPLQTFLDDPLRVLRTIRFATRFNFTMVEELHEAIQDAKIKDALAVKVSYERIGKETDQMMSGKNPERSVNYFYDYKLFSHLLKFPKSCEELQEQEKVDELTYSSLKVCDILGRCFSAIKKDGSLMSIEWPSGDELSEVQKYTFYAGILVPFRNYQHTVKKAQNEKVEGVHNFVMFESLKQPTKSKNFVHKCLSHLDDIIKHVNSEEFDVVEVGILLKELEECSDAGFLLALATEYYNTYLVDQQSDIDQEKLTEMMNKYEAFYQKVKDHKIDHAHLIKPLMNGKDIMKLYDVKGGPFMKQVCDEVFKWQLVHPDGQEDELKEYMIENKKKFKNVQPKQK